MDNQSIIEEEENTTLKKPPVIQYIKKHYFQTKNLDESLDDLPEDYVNISIREQGRQYNLIKLKEAHEE